MVDLIKCDLNKNQKKILKKIFNESMYNEDNKYFEKNGRWKFGSSHDYIYLKEKGFIKFVSSCKNDEFLAIDNIQLTSEGRQFMQLNPLKRLLSTINNNKLVTGLVGVIVGGVIVNIIWRIINYFI